MNLVSTIMLLLSLPLLAFVAVAASAARPGRHGLGGPLLLLVCAAVMCGAAFIGPLVDPDSLLGLLVQRPHQAYGWVRYQAGAGLLPQPLALVGCVGWLVLGALSLCLVVLMARGSVRASRVLMLIVAAGAAVLLVTAVVAAIVGPVLREAPRLEELLRTRVWPHQLVSVDIRLQPRFGFSAALPLLVLGGYCVLQVALLVAVVRLGVGAWVGLASGTGSLLVALGVTLAGADEVLRTGLFPNGQPQLLVGCVALGLCLAFGVTWLRGRQDSWTGLVLAQLSPLMVLFYLVCGPLGWVNG